MTQKGVNMKKDNNLKRLKKRKVLLSALSVVLVTILAVSLAFMGVGLSRQSKLEKIDFSALNGLASRTIMFIGDGMGENHIKNTEAYYGEQTFMRSLGVDGFVSTFSNNVGLPTDSAAAGSALATGKKFNNGEVARHGGKNVQSIAEYAKQRGMGVGIVTTDSLSGATPASFSSHANNRGDTSAIIEGQINDYVDLYLGAGKDTYQKYKTRFENKGFTFATSFDEVDAGFSGDKLIMSFSSLEASDGTANTPTLEMCTKFALKFMEERFADKGYFLMIEGAHIDKKSHKNDIVPMVEYLRNFDASIKCAREFLDGKDCAIIVTADHETGGLKYKEGATKDDVTNKLYTSPTHTKRDVKYFIYVSRLGTTELKNIIPKNIDNTDVNRIAHALITA